MQFMQITNMMNYSQSTFFLDKTFFQVLIEPLVICMTDLVYPILIFQIFQSSGSPNTKVQYALYLL